MFTLIIADGLTKQVLSPESRFQDDPLNVGASESARLLGTGKERGRGPLPAFLRRVSEAQHSGAAMAVIVLADADEAGTEDSPAAEAGVSALVEPVAEIAGDACVITTAAGVIPWQELSRQATRLAGLEGPLLPTADNQLRFLVAGCETDKRILGIAGYLRNVLGFTDVAVCSHLVGSRTREAHFATLRHFLPGAGVKVFLDLSEAERFVGLDSGQAAYPDQRPPAISPADAANALQGQQRSIVELLCMHWSRVELRPLAGGYSGSLLFLAHGFKGEARTEPMVMKIDGFAQMRKEIVGYHGVKDFLGKHVPTFGHPVTIADHTGVAMDLAAMEGSPETLQDAFEAADNEAGLNRFLLRLEKALTIISEKLHRNTSRRTWVAPYRAFGLQLDLQVEWLEENSGHITRYLAEAEAADDACVDAEQIGQILSVIAGNDDGVETEVCLSHGDLNFQNIICDQGDNIWFIDWTYSQQWPLELDFAKLECDVKFVMTKEFDVEDLARVRLFEEYLLSHRIPADAGSLPDKLKFAKWDLRFRKILASVRKIREACFRLKEGEDWLVYQTALLRYSLHTTSFDQRRGRGECDLPQLAHALYSVEGLVFALIADDFHLKIRGDRPAAYPPRQRISIDESLWAIPCPSYDPPYYVDPTVLAAAGNRASDWADPEDFLSIASELAERPAKRHDDHGRPLNPRGRTGIAGRGLLGSWGANASVAAIVTRKYADSDAIEILLGNEANSNELTLLKGFGRDGDSPTATLERVLEQESGWSAKLEAAHSVFEGYTYDPRQTDHAWVEVSACHVHAEGEATPSGLRPGGVLEEIRWLPLSDKTINSLPSNQAGFVRAAIKRLQELGHMVEADAEALLTKTG